LVPLTKISADVLSACFREGRFRTSGAVLNAMSHQARQQIAFQWSKEPVDVVGRDFPLFTSKQMLEIKEQYQSLTHPSASVVASDGLSRSQVVEILRKSQAISSQPSIVDVLDAPLLERFFATFDYNGMYSLAVISVFVLFIRGTVG
jgi:hypothetical protein